MVPFRLRHADVVVGVFVLLALGMLVVTAFFVVKGRRLFEERVTYRTLFREGYGIAPGNGVTIAGIDVGIVRDVTLTPANYVEVVFNVRKSFADRVREDSVAEVKSPPGLGGFIGGTGIKISVGDPKRRAVAPGSLVVGKDPLSIEDILRKINDEQVSDRGRSAISNVENLLAALGSPEGPVQTILENVSVITTRLKEGEGSAGQILNDDGKLLKQVNGLFGQLRQHMKTVERILENVEVATSQVGEVAARTPELTEKVSALLDRVPELLANILIILTDVKTMAKQMNGVSDDVPRMLSRVEVQLGQMEELLGALRKNFLIRAYLPDEATASPLDPGLFDHGSAPR